MAGAKEAQAPPAPAARRRSRALPLLAGVLVVLGGVYMALPPSWFEVPEDTPGPAAGRPAVGPPPGAGMPPLPALESAARSSPADFRARSRFGMALAAAGRTAEARRELQAAVRLAPNEPAVHHNLGMLLLSSGQPRAAEEAFQRQIELVPGDSRAHYFRGQALLAMGRLKHAAAQFQIARDLAPDAPDPWLGLATALADSQPEEKTVELVNAYLARGGSPQVAYTFLSRGLRAKRKYAEAARYAEMAVQADPRSYSGLRNLGEIYTLLNRFQEAEQTLLKAVPLAKNPGTLYVALGKNAEKAGRAQDAVRFYRDALQHDRETYVIHLYLSRALARAGQQEEALREERLFRQLERRERARQLATQRSAPARGTAPMEPR